VGGVITGLVFLGPSAPIIIAGSAGLWLVQNVFTHWLTSTYWLQDSPLQQLASNASPQIVQDPPQNTSSPQVNVPQFLSIDEPINGDRVSTEVSGPPPNPLPVITRAWIGELNSFFTFHLRNETGEDKNKTKANILYAVEFGNYKAAFLCLKDYLEKHDFLGSLRSDKEFVEFYNLGCILFNTI